MRIIYTGLLAAFAAVSSGLLARYRGVLLESSATLQFEDSRDAYAEALMRIDLCRLGEWALPLIAIFLILLLWKDAIQNALDQPKMKRKTGRLLIVAALASAVALSGCRPPEGKAIRKNMVEISPNNTAFIIPLEGSTSNQKQFQSVESLKKAQVATKRIEIPVKWMQTGRMPWQGEWMPTHRVIGVDRTVVSREWQKDPNLGTKRDDQSIGVESLESIGFSVNIVISALIEETNAATYLYWFGTKSLANVVDENIRNDVASELAIEFGGLSLSECRGQKGEVIQQVKGRITAKYANMGITVSQLGINGGLQYDDPQIQQSINEEFKTQNEAKLAQNRLEAQRIENLREEEIAAKDRKVAEELALAAEAYKMQRGLEIAREAVARWNGDVPRFVMVPGDGLDGLQMLMPMPKAD